MFYYFYFENWMALWILIASSHEAFNKINKLK